MKTTIKPDGFDISKLRLLHVQEFIIENRLTRIAKS